MKDIVLKRIMILATISIICFVVGIAYGIATGDKLLIIMSMIICVVNVYKIWDIRNIEKKNKYILLSGDCIDSQYNPAGRFRIYKIRNGNDVLEVSVPKNIKLSNNESYIFYFKEMDQSVFQESKWIRNKLLSDNFIGYEIIDKKEGDEE